MPSSRLSFIINEKSDFKLMISKYLRKLDSRESPSYRVTKFLLKSLNCANNDEFIEVLNQGLSKDQREALAKMVVNHRDLAVKNIREPIEAKRRTEMLNQRDWYGFSNPDPDDEERRVTELIGAVELISFVIFKSDDSKSSGFEKLKKLDPTEVAGLGRLISAFTNDFKLWEVFIRLYEGDNENAEKIFKEMVKFIQCVKLESYIYTRTEFKNLSRTIMKNIDTKAINFQLSTVFRHLDYHDFSLVGDQSKLFSSLIVIGLVCENWGSLEKRLNLEPSFLSKFSSPLGNEPYILSKLEKAMHRANVEIERQKQGTRVTTQEIAENVLKLCPLPYTDPAPSNYFPSYSHQRQHPGRSYHTRSNSFTSYPNLTKSSTNLVNIRPNSRNRSFTHSSSTIAPTSPSNQLLRSSSVLGGSLGRPSSRMHAGSYDALNDPHLREYFERKFNLSTAKRKKNKERKPKFNECVYKVTVKTGNINNASTDANVYLTLFGKRGCVQRRRLFNKFNAIRTQEGYKYKFERNSTSVFKFIGLDVGSLTHMIVEHDGVEVNSSWYLQSVIVTNTKLNRSWLFELNDWLSLHYGLGKTKIQLFPTRELEKYTHTDYEIVTITGDVLGAGTDATVFVTLHGTKNRSSQKLKLKNNDVDTFKRAKTDIFKVHSNFVGPIERVTVEHDNMGKSPGWFLDRLVITDLKDPTIKYYCQCNKWLSKEEGDGLIRRELHASTDPFGQKRAGKYKVTVFTANKSKAGTDAEVTLVMFGTAGDSGEWKLSNKGQNNFERGQKDEFMVECLSIGEIKKIRIGHNNKGINPGWFLDKVIIDDMENHRVYEFLCNRWLAVDEEDGKTTVFLYPGVGATHPAQEGVPYILNIFTGDVKNAGTSARVFVELFGGRYGDESSGRIMLNEGQFKRGMNDKVHIETDKMLSPLTHIIIGHDNSGVGPGWFLEKVEVESPSIGMVQVFPCDRWLAKDEDDGKIERKLHENTALRRQHKSQGVWYVWVYTSNLKKAGTDANVYMTIYGDKGKTDDIKLGNKRENFEVGKCDEFKIEANHIGQPFKIRIGHDNKGTAPGWHLDRIELENMETKEHYFFHCNRWLAKDEEDGQIVRELPAEGDGIRKPLPIVNYTVEVYTGNKSGAGTDADVFLNIFGDLGDTGDRPLDHSEKHKNKFERNQVDVFKIEAVTLKKLHKIRIGHNGKGAGAGWYLNKVVVKQDGNPKYDQTFECNRWLATDEDDGAIVRELFADQTGQFLDTISYHISVKTGDVRNAGTDATVTMKISGEKGDTGKLVLKHSENPGNKFERGRVDLFKIDAEDIGKIEKIHIGHNGKGLGSGWFLGNVQIDVPSKGYRYLFSANRWLDENEGDRQIEMDLYPTEVKKMKKLIPYVVKVKTGKKRGAGTDANVFLQLYGSEGKSEEIQLRNHSDNFESGKEDVFKIEADDVGPLVKVRIGHDNKGASSGWFLDNLHIQRHAIRGSKRLKRHARQGSTVSVDREEIEDYYFPCNRWFARDEDDREIVRELIACDQDGRPVSGLEEIPYEVKVFTGNKSGAGTDANVFLNIFGMQGTTGERELRKSDKRNKFERNQVDTFTVKAFDLGQLEKIKIRHDNSGPGSAWYLDRVEIMNPHNGQTYLFVCENWLASNEGDGKTSRELLAIDPRRVHFKEGDGKLSDKLKLEIESQFVTYNVNVVTSDKRNAGTDANVYIQLFGKHDDTGVIDLVQSKTHRNKFERGQTDVFEIKAADVGNLRKIRIGHDGKGLGAGWHLKEVIIDAPKLGKTWKFPCDRWLDKSQDDGKIERDLEPLDLGSQEYTPFVPYEIVVYTSDKKNADTSANPYIVLYGPKMHSSQVNLCKNKIERKDKFKRSGVDRFILELEDVGPIEKIRIGHDNAGLGAGWHVDRVEIRRLREDGRGSETQVFPCNRWLARDEDDRAIERELVPTKKIKQKVQDGELYEQERDIRKHLDMINYVVEVFTGDVSGAGTNANVFLTIYGSKGDTGERKLVKSETYNDKFERKHMDRFKIEAADLGRLEKILIRHDNGGFSPDWFLDRVEIDDGMKRFVFPCERWLSKTKEDKKIERVIFEQNFKGSRELSASSKLLRSNIGGSNRSLSDGRQSPFRRGDEETYKITIRTGSERNCGTDAQVFVRLFGMKKRQVTDRIFLRLAKSKRFMPGSSENFQIEAPDVGELAQIEIGHDGIGSEAGWFVKDIEITEPKTGKTYNIKCNCWLSTEQGDGLTIRRFNVEEGTALIKDSKTIPHRVVIYTGDIPHGGTDSNVTLKFFGSKGSSSDVFIEKMENRFEKGAVDSFRVDLDDVGSLKKIRVTHDGKGSRREWFLEKIEVSNEKTGKMYKFVVNEWLSKSKKESRGLTIDVPLLTRDGYDAIEKTDYRIKVKTSDISGAGTDANVFVTLFGENGDSGELELKKSETNFNMFERNKTDVFTFKGILSLGELAKLRIRHDNSGTLIGNASWHLDSVVVEDLAANRGQGKSYMFNCKKWLSLSKDDKQIVRELVPTGPQGESLEEDMVGERTAYEVTIVTADQEGAGTKNNVILILVGENNRETRPKLFENTDQMRVFRRRQEDAFVLKERSVGSLKKIILNHVSDRPRGREDAWICEQVIVKDQATGITYYFPVRDVLLLNDKPKSYRCENKKENLVNKTRHLKNIEYEVTVVTGNESGAGTDAKVSITIYGENGESGKRPLKGKFEKNATEKFLVECLDLGRIKKVHIEHDNSSFKKHWLLDRIEIRDPTTNQVTVFPCNKWLSKTKEDGEIARDLFPLIEDRPLSRGSPRFALKDERFRDRDEGRLGRERRLDSSRDRDHFGRYVA